MSLAQSLKGIRDLINRKRLVTYYDLARRVGMEAGETVSQETSYDRYAVLVIGLKPDQWTRPFDVQITESMFDEQITDLAVFLPPAINLTQSDRTLPLLNDGKGMQTPDSEPCSIDTFFGIPESDDSPPR